MQEGPTTKTNAMQQKTITEQFLHRSCFDKNLKQQTATGVQKYHEMKTPITMTQTYYQVFPINYIFQKGQTTKTIQPNNKQKEQ